MESGREGKLLEGLSELGYPFPESPSVFLVPGEARFHVQQWLLEQFEPNIFSQPDIDLPNYTKFQKLQLLYDQLGIQYDSIDAIRGNSGFEASLAVLEQLVDFAKASRAYEGVEEGRKLISHIAGSAANLFSSHVHIFPPTFPAKYIGHSGSKDLEPTIKYWQQQLSHCKMQLSAYEVDTTLQLAQSKDIVELREKMKEFIAQVRAFRQDYEDTWHKVVTGQNSPPLELGKYAHKAMSQYSEIKSMLDDIESIWSFMQTYQST